MTATKALAQYRWRRAAWATRKRTAQQRFAPVEVRDYFLYVEANYAAAKLTQAAGQ